MTTTLTRELPATLRWHHPHAFQQTYELRAGNEVVGMLRFPSLLRFHAVGQLAGGTWRFERRGFLTGKIVVLPENGSMPVGELVEKFPGHSGTVTLADGRRLVTATSWLLNDWTLKTELGRNLIHYHRIGGVLHHSATVDLEGDRDLINRQPWLVLLGWYQLVLKFGESA